MNTSPQAAGVVGSWEGDWGGGSYSWKQDSIQAPFLSLVGAATSIIFVATNIFVVTNTCLCLSQHKTRLLLRQMYACHDKSFVTTNIFLSWQNLYCDKHMLLATSLFLSRQTRVCGDKTVVATNMCLSGQIFVATKLVSQQKYFVVTNVTASILLSQQKMCFVVTNMCLSWQKWYLWQLLPILSTPNQVPSSLSHIKPPHYFPFVPVLGGGGAGKFCFTHRMNQQWLTIHDGQDDS